MGADASGSQLVLGGTDPSLYSGSFQYHNLSSETYWEINVGDLTVAGEPMGFSGVKGVVDSGTSLLVGASKFITPSSTRSARSPATAHPSAATPTSPSSLTGPPTS